MASSVETEIRKILKSRGPLRLSILAELLFEKGYGEIYSCALRELDDEALLEVLAPMIDVVKIKPPNYAQVCYGLSDDTETQRLIRTAEEETERREREHITQEERVEFFKRREKIGRPPPPHGSRRNLTNTCPYGVAGFCVHPRRDTMPSAVGYSADECIFMIFPTADCPLSGVAVLDDMGGRAFPKPQVILD